MIVAIEQQDADRVRAGSRTARRRRVRAADVRAGIATGHALLFEGDDYIGSAVNMAARLCDYATDFDVLMPTMHLDRLPEGVTAEPFGEIELRGFPGPIDVVRLTGAPVGASNDTGELWTRNPFV